MRDRINKMKDEGARVDGRWFMVDGKGLDEWMIENKRFMLSADCCQLNTDN